MTSYQNLPHEILVDIFSRVPAKSIGRSRCVSKPWRALLSQPYFIRSHLTQSINRREESLLLITDDWTYLCSAPLRDAEQVLDKITIPATKLSFANHPDSWTRVHAYCDGLVLVEDKEDKNFVLNPVTREIREVPCSPFALDPCQSFIMYGLGYDSLTDDYKIVTVSYYVRPIDERRYTRREDEPFCIEMFVNVYSLKTGTWKRAESSPYDHVVGHVTPGVFVNGYIHWIACRKPDNTSVILAFDFVEEKFREVPPPSSEDKFVYNLLVVLDGCLCMFDECDDYVWAMKEYGVQDSWTKFTIDDPEAVGSRPICMSGREEIVLLKEDEEMAMYNMKEGTKKDIVVDGILDNLFVEVSFVESLVSPFGW